MHTLVARVLVNHAFPITLIYGAPQVQSGASSRDELIATHFKIHSLSLSGRGNFASMSTARLQGDPRLARF